MELKLKPGFLLLIVILFTGLFVHAQNEQAIVSSFNKINEVPGIITVTNTFDVNNKGGHIQGIQLFPYENEKYVLLTGSSDSYSYYLVIKLGKNNKVISVNQLMDKPYKHAGGCQIYQNYMAVGIEDNNAKDKARVCIYEISDPEIPPVEPIAVIERKGEPFRSTAGCTGITKYKDNLLLAVGDWDTKHIDFYSCKINRLKKDSFKLTSSVEVAGISKEGWIDNSWSAYQNINLFTFNDNELYLVGLGQNSSNENVADLFRLTETETGKFNFKKIAAKKFGHVNEASFKAAAGITLTNNNELNVISCGYNIENKLKINYFGYSK